MSAAWPTSMNRCAPSCRRSNPSVNGRTRSGSSCRLSFTPAGLGALTGFLHRLPREYRYGVEVRHRAFFEDPRSEHELEKALGDVGAEWIAFDTTVLFASPPTSDGEREAWGKKPRLPRRSRALTANPVVRYIGRDDTARTVAGWQPWLDTVAGWLREGRSPTVFIHTPDNVDALDARTPIPRRCARSGTRGRAAA